MNSRGISIALGYEAGLTTNSGISRYTRELCAGLMHHPDISAVRRFAHGEWLVNTDPETAASQATSSSQKLRQTLSALRSHVPAPEPFVRLLKDWQSNRLLAASAADIYHEPNYALRATVLPSAVSVHDLGIFLYPEYHPAIRLRHLTREIPLALNRADRIITLSHLVKGQIVEMFNVDPANISVVPIGLNTIFHARSESDCEFALRGLGLQWKQFLLFVGTLEPRKNLERILKSLSLMPPSIAKRFPLVVAGGGGWGNDAIKRELQAAVQAGLVVSVGTVTDSQLATLYAAARGVVFVSYYEGQGLPAIEAAASGTPLLISEGSAMTEQVGKIALTCSPRDEVAIADGMRRLIEDEHLGARSLAEAPLFIASCSMKQCVQQTVDVYKAILAKRSKTC